MAAVATMQTERRVATTTLRIVKTSRPQDLKASLIAYSG
jgi:hypothetical protein